jgi:4-amino-4-deoxy-L-arabinose transferase-like glycosyltransferase
MSGRRGAISNRVTGYAFYGLVALWVTGIVAGMLLHLQYVERRYGGVTLPLYGGCLLGVLTILNLLSGSIWRGRARSIDRDSQRVAYWVALLVMAFGSVLLLVVGTRNRRDPGDDEPRAAAIENVGGDPSGA